MRKTETANRRCLKRVVSRLLDDIPTSWLDSLLTGPDAALHGDGGTWGCPDIERLLKRIKERMTKTANVQSSGTRG
jgi:hypothetical protein